MGNSTFVVFAPGQGDDGRRGGLCSFTRNPMTMEAMTTLMSSSFLTQRLQARTARRIGIVAPMIPNKSKGESDGAKERTVRVTMMVACAMIENSRESKVRKGSQRTREIHKSKDDAEM
ncbi:hypothetical protein BHE74_00002888 [Ensete ventricosum]|nr:hypothetical protein GW17_00017163 [Ensete ventricosum]RWW88249.1 hypothetical protein BHE74_00002888 [Ensete ventricosum]